MRLFWKKDIVIKRKAHNYNDPFLQPLAVAIVSAILVALILTTGLLEIKRSEKNLIAFMEDQALSTIGVLERLTGENLRSIVAKTSPSKSGSTQEEASYSKRWVVDAITEMALNLDEQWKQGRADDNYLRKFAMDNNFLYVGLLNAQGNAVFQNAPLQFQSGALNFRSDFGIHLDLFVYGHSHQHISG